mmetsp:Transcript_11258/g.24743  ORF Transcript_11258/g.24743 Transcript_11258/m.24743 type:complete len:210 (-) Transcript_11258:882-1511(-)
MLSKRCSVMCAARVPKSKSMIRWKSSRRGASTFNNGDPSLRRHPTVLAWSMSLGCGILLPNSTSRSALLIQDTGWAMWIYRIYRKSRVIVHMLNRMLVRSGMWMDTAMVRTVRELLEQLEAIMRVSSESSLTLVTIFPSTLERVLPTLEAGPPLVSCSLSNHVSMLGPRSSPCPLVAVATTQYQRNSTKITTIMVYSLLLRQETVEIPV